MNKFKICLIVFVLLGFNLALHPVAKATNQAIQPQETSSLNKNEAPLTEEAKQDFSDGADGIGSGFKKGTVVTGRAFKNVGKTIASGFQKAGFAIKNLFTGKRGTKVEERDLKAERSNKGNEESAFRYVSEDDLPALGDEAGKAEPQKNLVKEESKSDAESYSEMN